MEATLSFDSSGNFSLDPGYLAVTGQKILATQHNPPLEDISAALSQVLLRSGVAPMIGPLNLNSFKILNLANGTDDSDAVNYSQIKEPVAPKFTSSVVSGSAASSRGFRGTVDGAEVFSIYYDNTKTVMNSGGTGWYVPDPLTMAGEPLISGAAGSTPAANRGFRFTIDGVELGYILQENGGMLVNSSGYQRTVLNGTERTRTIPEGLGVGVAVEKTSVSDTGLGVFSSINGLVWANRDNAVTAILKRSGTDGAVIQFGKATTAVGTISVTATATAYNTSSDGRLKTDLQPIPADFLDQINVYNHAWKNHGGRAYGVVAQELFDVFPQAVTKGENPDDMWSVDYSKLVPILIASIKDLRTRINLLEGAAVHG